MDYQAMQNQPRPGRLSPATYLRDPRRRAIAVGILMALVGLAILIWPRERSMPPSQGDDVATLATLVNLPAVPVSVHWAVAPMTASDSGRVPGATDWSLNATLTFAPSDAARITGADVFYKAPLLTGKLMRVDDTHFQLILNTQ
jgi:hypothetical protein